MLCGVPGISVDLFAIREEEGVCGTANDPVVVFCRGSEVGVMGKGIANSFEVPFIGLIRDFIGVFERVGDGGHSSGADEDVARDFGDFGESEASR